MSQEFVDLSKKERRLNKRRQYYRKNHQHIRERDNKNAAKKRAENPEKYRDYTLKYLENKKKKREAFDPNTYKDLNNNPDAELIRMAIIREMSEKS